MDSTHYPGPSTTHDKSKVLEVKPLRCLVPWFPAPPLGLQSPAPFVPAPPFGPFPSGYSPFYPFFNPSEPHGGPGGQQHHYYPQGSSAANGQGGFFSQNSHPTTHATPISSFRTPIPYFPAQNGDAGSSRKSSRNHELDDDEWSNNRKRTANFFTSSDLQIVDGEKPKSRSQKRPKISPEIKFFIPADGDKESVCNLLMKFDALRRRLSQVEDTKEATPGVKRADLKAGTIMYNNGLRTNTRKRVGTVPGVEVGDVFYFRIEMCMVGLHAPVMAGIDYMSLKFEQEEETVAVSIVSSGGYGDDAEDGEVLIYSGQGGAPNKKEGKEAADQKLERGNLALERSFRRGNEVRVIRGVKDVTTVAGKVYIYDGLYKIHESWMEKGKAGCNVFKYKLMRVPGQPQAFVLWKSIQHWKENSNLRPGVILPDLTSGAEKLPVCLVNDVDDAKGPAHFTYFPKLKYSRQPNSMTTSYGCSCRNSCAPGDHSCVCAQKNAGDLPYVANGVLVMRKPFIYECGSSCQCYPNCRNQVSQNGLKVRLEVFRTKDRGWGLRSWDPIRAGMFICEYAGQVVEKINLEESRDEDEEDDYIFNAAHSSSNTYKWWNYIPELLGEDSNGDTELTSKAPLSLVISAKNFGNVARFMNHSCSPNVFWQPVLYDHNDESCPHIAFYAIKHIPPMTELTYDYGFGETASSNGNNRRKQCLCGSPKCRGYFG